MDNLKKEQLLGMISARIAARESEAVIIKTNLFTLLAVHASLLFALRHPGNKEWAMDLVGWSMDLVKEFISLIERTLREHGLLTQTETGYFHEDEAETAEDKEKYCWDAFAEFCEDEGIDLEYAEDFLPWWKCWTRAMDVAETILT